MIISRNNPLLKKTDIAGIIIKPEPNDIKDIYFDIIKTFKKTGFKILIEKISADTLGLENGLEFDTLCKQSDFLVTLGGDGTLISVTRRGFKHQKAVMGINLGTLGFLTDIMPNELESFLKDLKNEHYRVDHRMMIQASIGDKEVVSFNDVVISRKGVTGMVKIDAKIDGKTFNRYHADGLIVSTPTGSTAYNLSCNGPVVYPLTDAFIVTPISAHSLTQRPLVLPGDFKICFENVNSESAIVIVDGHDTYELKQNEKFTIQIASAKAKLIHRIERNYFDVLNKKLQWGAN